MISQFRCTASKASSANHYHSSTCRDAIPREMKRLSHNTSETNISLASKEHFLRPCKVFIKCLFDTLLFLQVPECRIVSTDAEKFELEGIFCFCLFVARHTIPGLLLI